MHELQDVRVAVIKNATTAGRQRYKCHDCGYNYSVELKSTAKNNKSYLDFLSLKTSSTF